VAGSNERSWHSNDVRTVNIDGNVSGNEDEECRRKVWKDLRMRVLAAARERREISPLRKPTRSRTNEGKKRRLASVE